MQNEWILDVLADLKTFALANDLGRLAEQLNDTQLIAATEIASKSLETRTGMNGNDDRSGPISDAAGRHQRA